MIVPEEGFIDIHHHILPGVDDGPKTMEEAEAMLALAYQEGTRHIIATSHFDPMGDCPDVSHLNALLAQLNALCDEKFPGLRISLGAEVLFGEGMRRRLRAGTIPTMAGSSYVLVEFVPSIKKEELEKAVRHLANGGYVTILAHMERYNALVRDIPFTRYLKSKYGTLLQVNADTFLTRQNFFSKRFLKKAMAENLIDFIASDAHNLTRRRTRLGEVYRQLSDNYGIDAATNLLFKNPFSILSKDNLNYHHSQEHLVNG